MRAWTGVVPDASVFALEASAVAAAAAAAAGTTADGHILPL